MNKLIVVAVFAVLSGACATAAPPAQRMCNPSPCDSTASDRPPVERSPQPPPAR